jgi:hypothetical protein
MNCCKNKLCFSCLYYSGKDNNCCPYCRTIIIPKHIIYMNKIQESELYDKDYIIKNSSIYSKIDNLKKIIQSCKLNGMKTKKPPKILLVCDYNSKSTTNFGGRHMYGNAPEYNIIIKTLADLVIKLLYASNNTEIHNKNMKIFNTSKKMEILNYFPNPNDYNNNNMNVSVSLSHTPNYLAGSDLSKTTDVIIFHKISWRNKKRLLNNLKSFNNQHQNITIWEIYSNVITI